MGIQEHDRQDIINYIKKKQTKPTIHLRIHYFAKFPEIGTNQRLFFDEDIYADIKTGDVIAYCGIHLISKLVKIGNKLEKIDFFCIDSRKNWSCSISFGNCIEN